MTTYCVNYSIDGKALSYEVDGALAETEDKILLRQDDDLTSGLAWHNDGYSAVNAWDQPLSDVLQQAVSKLLNGLLSDICQRPVALSLEGYHNHISDGEHMAVLERLKELPLMANEIIPLELLDQHISTVLEKPVSCYNPRQKKFGCNIRVVRPNRNDNNPLHKDVWLDHLRNAINLYVPIAGSNELSSLSLIPGSHHWKESEITRTEDNCFINGLSFTVPSVLQTPYGLAMTRPPLAGNQILIFTPYLIHGGACNLNQDITRISLEMRFWRKK